MSCLDGEEQMTCLSASITISITLTLSHHHTITLDQSVLLHYIPAVIPTLHPQLGPLALALVCSVILTEIPVFDLWPAGKWERKHWLLGVILCEASNTPFSGHIIWILTGSDLQHSSSSFIAQIDSKRYVFQEIYCALNIRCIYIIFHKTYNFFLCNILYCISLFCQKIFWITINCNKSQAYGT